MKVIAVTGMPGAGKDVVSNTIIETKKIPMITMRSVVEKEIEEKGIPVNNKTLREYATKLREEYGYDIVARKCLPLIRKQESDMIILNGIRGLSEVDFFRKELEKDFILIAVHASPKIRFERLKQRGLKWDMKTKEEFDWRDRKELGWGIGSAIALADYMIINEGSLDELKSKVKKLLKVI